MSDMFENRRDEVVPMTTRTAPANGRSADSTQPIHIRILAAVRSAGLVDGSTVPGEVQLAAALNVARPQVREGLRVLEAFGAIDSRQGARRIWRGFDGGTFGEQLGGILGGGSAELLRDFLEIRQTLETTLLPQAVERLTRADILRIRSLANEMVELAERGQSFTRADEDFHRELFRGLGNTMLVGMMGAYWRIYQAFTGGRPGHEDRPAVARKHVAIVQAISDGDIRLAVHELDAHFYGVRRRIEPSSTPPTRTEAAS